MKKRILATFMALAMVVTAITPQIFATVDDIQSATVGESVTTNVKYSQTSTFSVIVPKAITLDSNKTSSYTVDVNGDIASDVKVVVIPDETVTMEDINDIKADVIGTIEQDKTEWLYNELDVNATGLVSAKDLTAGTWKGIFYFNINMTSNVSESNLTLSADGDMFMGSGEQNQVNAYINGVEANDQVTWVSDNAKIQVNDGLITTSSTAEAGDTATITVTAKNQEAASTYARTYSNLRAANNEDVSIDFQVTVVDITYNLEGIEITPGDSATVTAKVIPEELNGIVRWTQTAVSGISLSKNGNTVTINVSSDMPAGRTYQLIASYGDFSKALNIKIVDSQASHTHSYTSTVTKAATCEEDGVKTFTCVDGDDTYTQVIPATGHNYENGKCTNCGVADPDAQNPVIQEAGLYDANGNMVCTWEDSGIDVETNYTYSTYKTSTTSGYYVLTNIYPTVTKVVIPDGATSIGDYAFFGCTNLTSVIIPDGVTSIGDDAFYGCGSLISVIIPDSATSIGNAAFAVCKSLTNITIPNSVTSIGIAAFSNCESLTNITIPDSATSIGTDVFYGCKSLTSITIPDGVTSIGDNAFYGCESLTNITIPNSVISIGNSAFYGCESLISVIIPDSMTSIESYAFKYCINLTSIIIPDNVTSIGDFAFSDCTSLTSVIIGNSVTSIGMGEFKSCRKLTSVTFTNTTGWYIGSSAGAKTTVISSTNLANTSTAATYLKSTYLLKYWTRK